MTNIWVIADNQEYIGELITKAASFKTKITAFINGDEAAAEECFAYGANSVKLLSLPSTTTWEQYAPQLAEIAKQEKPGHIFVSGTKRGKTLGAYMAGFLKWPYVSESKDIKLEGGKTFFTRTIFGGLAEKEIMVEGEPVIVTFAPGTFTKERLSVSNSGDVTIMEFSNTVGVEVVERKEKEATTINLNEAETVIGVGRGFGTLENMKYAEELATILNGELGCSRPVTEDLHWLPEERYIGISGAVIKPNLYLCAGISGQIQHVYGIRDSKTIVAIDKNENAPIFNVADYYIVGDLEEVLPELISALK